MSDIDLRRLARESRPSLFKRLVIHTICITVYVALAYLFVKHPELLGLLL